MQGDLIPQFLPRCSICQSISKLHLMCGFRVGWYFLLALSTLPDCQAIYFFLLIFEYLHKDEMLWILAYLLIKLNVTLCVWGLFFWLYFKLITLSLPQKPHFIMLMVCPERWKHRWFLWNIWISGPMTSANLKFNKFVSLLVREIQRAIYYQKRRC